MAYVPDFLAIATKMVGLGGHVYPVPMGQKALTVPNWQNLATRDLATIAELAKKTPNANVAVVAKPDGLWLFDCDDPDILTTYERAHGPLQTYRVRSVSGGLHLYFKQNDASREMGNIGEKSEAGDELWSARADNRYVISAGSVAHPNNDPNQPLAQYRVVKDFNLPAIEAPAEFIAFLKSRTNSQPRVKLTAAADGPIIARGGHDNYLFSLACKMRQEGLEEEAIYNALVEVTEKRLENYGSDYLDMCRNKAKQACKYPAGSSDIPLLHAGIPVEQLAAAKQVAQLIQAGAPALSVVDDLPPLPKEELPEFPEMCGALWELAKEMYPDIPLSFKFMSLLTIWGLLRSGVDTFHGRPALQPRFYTCLIAKPGTGKGAAMNEALNWMREFVPASMSVVGSVDSGPSLVDDFGELQKLHPAATNWKMLLHCDEITDLFEKSKSTAQSRNTLSQTILTLFESTTVSNRARNAHKGQRTQVDRAHFAIIGGTTKEGYEEIWVKTGGGANGLQSRFCPIFADGKMPIFPRESTALATERQARVRELLKKPAQLVCLEEPARKVMDEWGKKCRDNEDPAAIRVADIVTRLLIVLAVSSLDLEDMLDSDNVAMVNVDMARRACRFGDYIIEMRTKMNPADSYTFVQAFVNSIIKVFDQNPNRPLSQRDVRQAINATKRPGGITVFLQAWDSILKAGMIVQTGFNRVGKPMYQREPEEKADGN